jgi:hypothetical protein
VPSSRQKKELPVLAHFHLEWPSAAVDASTLARRLLTLADETHFVEIGLEAPRESEVDPAADTVSSVRRALQDAIESSDDAERAEIAARLSALLHAIEDEGLSLSVTVEPRIVETGDGVGRIDVLSLVVAHRSMADRPAAARQAVTA